MKFPLLYIMLLIFGSSLGQSSQMDLKSYFSESEIKDLNLIADFFQSELCGSSNQTEFSKCLTKSLPEYTELIQNYIGSKVSYGKQKKLYRTISSKTFNKIWGLCQNTLLIIEPNYVHTSICFSGNSLFIDFTKDLGENNRYLKYYGEKFEKIGSFDSGTFLTIDLMQNPSEWDLDNRNVQMFLAIHYLTQNDEMNRDKKVKRLMKRYDRKMNKKLKKTVPNKA